MRIFQRSTSIDLIDEAHVTRVATLPRWIGKLHLLLACLLMISMAAPTSAQRVATVSADGTIRLLQNPDCVGAECRWVDIDRNSRSIALAATLETIYQIHTSGAIWRWRERPCADGACPSWTNIDNNSQSVAITAGYSKLFQLHRNGSIWRFTGADCGTDGCRGWRRIDNNPRTQFILAAGDQLFQRHDNGSIWRWRGDDCDGERCLSWQQLDNNSNTVEIDFAARGSLFQRHRDGSIWRWDGQPCTTHGCFSWSRIDRNPATVDLLAAPGNLFQRHRAGAIWQWQGRPCVGGNCSFWTKVGDLPGLEAIAAGAQPSADVFTGDEGGPAPLFALYGDGRVARWGGEACTDSHCPNWADIGEAFTRYRSDRSRLYVFTGRLPNPDDRFVLIPPQPGDEDGDGLPDEWERQQTGLDVQPGRADLILVVVMRPELAANAALQTTLRQNLSRAKEFFSSVPVRTARGARGIHLTVELGLPLDDSFSESATPMRPYQEAREAGMPPELIGFAHGMLFGTDTGGGGQTSHPDWGVSGMDWRTIVHELV